MTEVHQVTTTIRQPRGNFHGEVAEGCYVVFENCVILTDRAGKPIGGDGTKRHLAPNDDARQVAARMVRQRRRASSPINGFDGRPIRYPDGY